MIAYDLILCGVDGWQPRHVCSIQAILHSSYYCDRQMSKILQHEIRTVLTLQVEIAAPHVLACENGDVMT